MSDRRSELNRGLHGGTSTENSERVSELSSGVLNRDFMWWVLEVYRSRDRGIGDFWNSGGLSFRELAVSGFRSLAESGNWRFPGIWELRDSGNLGFPGFPGFWGPAESGISGISGISRNWSPRGGGRGAFNKCIFLRFFGTPNVGKGSHFDNRKSLGDKHVSPPSKPRFH